MEKLIVNSYDEFASFLGKKLGESEWLEVNQERINLFADATLDHQWIHVDVERAKPRSQFKSTIAHGYLTLSLLPHLWEPWYRGEQHQDVGELWHGQDALWTGVVTGSKVRLVTKLHAISNIRGICKTEIEFKIEIEDNANPPSKASPPSCIILSKSG